MREVYYVAASAGQQYLASMTTGHDHSVRGEYSQRINGAVEFYPHSLRLDIHVNSATGKPATVIIRPTVPGAAFDIDMVKFAEVQKMGPFLFQGIVAVNERGTFKLVGTNDHGVVEILMTTDGMGIGAPPTSGMMVSVISTPFNDNDWGR